MKIDIDKPDASLRTSLIYGVFRSGKTHFSATFPRVAWFGSLREGGYETIKWMDRAHWYESDHPPQLYVVKTFGELLAHINQDVLPQVKIGKVQTIVLELSFYADDSIMARANEESWHKYQDLEKHIIFLDQMFKGYPGLRVCYNSLAATEDDPKKPSNLLIAGKAVARKIPALCDLVGYMRSEGNDHILHLNTYGNFPAGHRYGGHLPPLIKNPTFRMLENILNKRALVDDDGNVIAPLVTLPALAPLVKP